MRCEPEGTFARPRIAGAVLMVLTAIWALFTLRGAGANQDLAAQHERDLVH